MTDALANLDPWSELPRFLLLLVRVSGLVVFCPILGSELLPATFRAALAFVLAIVLLPLTPVSGELAGDFAGFAVVAVRELAVGFGLGLAARVVFDGIEGAAGIVAGQSGFALSSMIDPLTGNHSMTPALFQTLVATTLTLSADLHHLFIRGLVRSYDALPPAAVLPDAGTLDATVMRLGGRLFSVAVELAGPALVVTFAVDLVLVLVGRAMPQVSVLMVGYPLKVAVGILAMGILAFVTGSALSWVGETFGADGAAVLAAFGAR